MHPRFLIGALLASLVTAGVLLTPGCGWVDSGSIGSDCAPGTPVACCPCPWPEACPDGAPPLPPQCLDGGEDAGGDAMSALCPQGSCTTPPPGWDPAQFAIGPSMSLPECPAEAPDLAFEGMPEPTTEPPTCPTCSCDVPLGSCGLPTTWTVNSDPCTGGGVKTNFDPPAGWDGKCSADDAILADKLCNGVPCVASISISPPVIQVEACTPHSSEEPQPPLKFIPDGPWNTVGRACTRTPFPTCATSGGVCLPPSSGFAACVTHDGDLECPEGWPNRQLLYGVVDDQRTCSGCSCSPPEGATCSVKVHVYSDATCTAQPLEVDISPDMGGKCHPLMAGVALSGKAAELLDFQPGACLPEGGELVGDIVLADAKTICCSEPPTM